MINWNREKKYGVLLYYQKEKRIILQKQPIVVVNIKKFIKEIKMDKLNKEELEIEKTPHVVYSDKEKS